MTDDPQGPLSAEQQESIDRVKAALGHVAPADATRVYRAHPSEAERELARLREFIDHFATVPLRLGDADDPSCEPFNVQELANAAREGLTLEEAKERCRNQGL